MIEFQHVHKRYENGFVALKDIHLKIEQGEYVAIIGLSGAGKSTLIRCINRMHDISSGSLKVNGVEVSNLKGKEVRLLRRSIGMIFQSFNLVSRISALQNVLVSFVPEMTTWRKVLGLYTKQQKMEALEALDRMNILDKAFTRVDQLSGGQQQRVALARTLAQNPTIILADEPVASLDPITAKQVMTDFQQINEELNMTIIMNIHHVDLALKYATRVVGIRDGEIVYDGPTNEVTEQILDQIYNGKFEEELITK